jgi:UDP-N-acetylglucosamine 4,6-dehydratase/5-epimerase
MKILLTGSTGFLGRNILTTYYSNNYEFICIINSEKRYKEIDFLFKDYKIYRGDIADKNFIENIFKENSIDYVIHTAAMKYIDTCEIFKRDCIDTNVIGTLNICEFSKKYNVKNVLTISTDKAVNPSSMYGTSKLFSEKITLSFGFNVYQGVNFWNSDGSFIRKWRSAIRNNCPVNLYNSNHTRYFCFYEDMIKEIMEILIIKNNTINYPKFCYKIKIKDVFDILKNEFSDSTYIIKTSEENNFDKEIEEIDNSIEIKELSSLELKNKVLEIFK